METEWLSIIVIIYLAMVAYLGFRGYRATRSSADYMVAGRQIHPFIMALSYGATFISTSAIVGFGGAAALFGMGLLWLTVLNVAVGIFIAFAVLGRRTRRMGHNLQAHTFPELIGQRFNSRFIQGFSGLVIMVFMPLYAAAVLIATARYIEVTFGIPYNIAVTLFSVLVAAYVFFGGLKGVMYTDALQGVLMFVGMLILVIFTYSVLGGVVPAHKKLSALPAQIEQASLELATPELRAAAPASVPDEKLADWLIGGAGALKTATAAMSDEEKGQYVQANPDLAPVASYMKNHPELGKDPRFINRSVTLGIGKAGWRGWTRMPVTGSNFFYVLVTSIIMGVGIGVLAQPQLAVRFMTVKSSKELNRAILVGGIFIVIMTGVAFVVGNLSNVWFTMPENGGLISLPQAGGDIDRIIPSFINTALPAWFGAIFMLTLLSAAMSTISSQFHAIGTSIGRDFYEKGILGAKDHRHTITITRVGVVLALIATVLLSFSLPAGIVAAATAIFFGLCASAFLPMFIGGLYWKRMTKAGAISSLVAGFSVSFFWLMFVQQVSGKLPALMAQAWLGKATILPAPVLGIHWNWLEALFVGLPVSLVVAIVVSLLTRPASKAHLDRCFHGIGKNG